MLQIKIYDIVSSLPVSHTIYYRQRQVSESLTVVFHHSAVFKTPIKSIANFHVSQRHWPGIGYHFVLNYDERIYLTNYLDVISFHTGKNNSKTIGICFNANYDVTPPGPVMLKNAYYLLLMLEQKYNITNFTFHRDLNKTSCPGKLFDSAKFTANYQIFKNSIPDPNDFLFTFINS